MTLAAQVADEIKRAVGQAAGREVCGYVAATPDGDQLFLRARNLAAERGSFFISAAERDRIARHASARELRLVALVHSHQSSVELSERDRQGLAVDRLPWIVVRLTEEGFTYRCYSSRGV